MTNNESNNGPGGSGSEKTLAEVMAELVQAYGSLDAAQRALAISSLPATADSEQGSSSTQGGGPNFLAQILKAHLS